MGYAAKNSMAAPTAPARAGPLPQGRTAKFWRVGTGRVEVADGSSSAGTNVVVVMVTTAPLGCVEVKVSTIALEVLARVDVGAVVVGGATVEVVNVVSADS